MRHELRTPLAVMRPLIDMLLDGTGGQLDERQIGYVRMLDRSVDRLAAMITSLSESGWLESAALPEAIAAVPADALVKGAVADASGPLEEGSGGRAVYCRARCGAASQPYAAATSRAGD